jgi:hypothetical protein
MGGKQLRSKLFKRTKELGLNIPWRTSTVKSLKKIIAKSERQTIVNRLIDAGDFQGLINYAMVNPLSTVQATRLFNAIVADGKYILTFHRGEFRQAVALTERSMGSFISWMMGRPEAIESDEMGGSDRWYEIIENDIPVSKISLKKLPNTRTNKNGGFFPYMNTSDIDLTGIQIYGETDEIPEERSHCLIHCFELAGIDKSLIESVKLSYLSGVNIAKKDLKNIAEKIGRVIVIKEFNNGSDKIRTVKHGKIGEEIYIALFKNHYFPFKDTELTSYASKNYLDIKGEYDYKNISEWDTTKYKRNKKAKRVNSLTLVKRLYEQGVFQKLDMSKFAEASRHKDLKNHIYLDNINEEQRPREPKTKKENQNAIFFADTETFVNKSTHQLYLMGVVSKTSDDVHIFNVCDNDAKITYLKFMDFITNKGNQNAICFFHNLKYDYHPLRKFMDVRNTCEKDNMVYSITVAHMGKTVEFRDSFKMIPMALSKFGKSFNLDAEYQKKEAIAYRYYTPENNNKNILCAVYRKQLSKNDRLIFDKEMGSNVEFNPTEYYKKYLAMDCLVLKKGMEKFDEIIKSDDVSCGMMSIFDYLTISSLTDAFMLNNGAYDGVYEVCGNLRAYIAQAVYGGRVHCNTKYKKQIIEGKISDYDGCSLYPSAIFRLCMEFGLSKGMAKRMTDLNAWENYHYSIMTVKINKVMKHQNMPFIAVRTETSIDYVNEAPTEPVVIDSLTLQDYIKFHEIEYEILDGVYWDNGGNKTMGGLIKNLYDTRLKYKKSNPALAQVLKLMLNSSYGKTITKKTHTKSTFVNQKRFDKYVSSNFNTITKIDELNPDKFQITQMCADSSYNCGVVGCAILSMSKRIMNEVMDTANMNDFPIYYTDTDSLHMRTEHVEPLENSYREIYNRELNGKQLCQFHTDFDMKGAEDEIYATQSIFLGKKSYIDRLESKDKNGDKINGFHVRLKGITEAGIKHYCYENKCDEFKLFERLMAGDKITMVLNPYDKADERYTAMFQYKNGEVMTRESGQFVREIKF